MNTLMHSRVGLTLAGVLAVAVIYLATEHTAHVVSTLPYLFLLLCPIMHLFMHRGHGGPATHAVHHSEDKPNIAKRSLHDDLDRR